MRAGNLSPPRRAEIGKSRSVQLWRWLVKDMATPTWHVRRGNQLSRQDETESRFLARPLSHDTPKRENSSCPGRSLWLWMIRADIVQSCNYALSMNGMGLCTGVRSISFCCGLGGGGECSRKSVLISDWTNISYYGRSLFVFFLLLLIFIFILFACFLLFKCRFSLAFLDLTEEFLAYLLVCVQSLFQPLSSMNPPLLTSRECEERSSKLGLLLLLSCPLSHLPYSLHTFWSALLNPPSSSFFPTFSPLTPVF